MKHHREELPAKPTSRSNAAKPTPPANAAGRVAHLLWFSCALALFCARPGTSEPVRIAVAASLRAPMEEIVRGYAQKGPGTRIEAIYGSSGQFRSQIENGAPFDLFFAADMDFPRALKEKGFAASDVVVYARGRLALWSRTVDASNVSIRDLPQGRFRRIALANPRHAPYGMRAVESLRASGVYELVEKRLVYGENVSHALQMAESGAADVGFVALSLVIAGAKNSGASYGLVDEKLHLPLEHGYIITKRGGGRPEVLAFDAYVGGPESRAVLLRHGFSLPPARSPR